MNKFILADSIEGQKIRGMYDWVKVGVINPRLITAVAQLKKSTPLSPKSNSKSSEVQS